MFLGYITGFCGPNGSGKTLAMLEALAVPALQAGYPVVSSVPLKPSKIGCDDALFIPLEDVSMIPHLGVQDDPSTSLTGNRPCVLLLDEINALLPSRQTLDMPVELQRFLNQFRKPKVRVGWTAPAWARADKQLREVTQVVVTTEGTWPDRFLRDHDGKTPLRGPDGKRLRPDPQVDWPANRIFYWTGWDASQFDEFSLDDTRALLEPLWVKRYWRKRRLAMHLYDTNAQVRLLNGLLETTGSCLSCGGYRKRGACNCGKSHSPTDNRARARA